VAIASVNPSTGQTERQFDELTDAELDQKLERAVVAFGAFRRSSLADRAAALLRAAAILHAEKEALGRTMAIEMGKIAQAGRDEAAKCAWGCRFYAENAAAMLATESVATNAGVDSFVRYEPLGAILAIMPWNFPFWQVFRVAAPALMAGNVVLLKHA
jgi:succinate-semialdehyde dehydrogenase/glutarate-semialdehyde dehydrogenase